MARHDVCSGHSRENDVEITTDSQSPEVTAAVLSWRQLTGERFGLDYIGLKRAGILDKEMVL